MNKKEKWLWRCAVEKASREFYAALDGEAVPFLERWYFSLM